MAEVKTSIFKDGIVNNPYDPELVPRGGASESLGWITKGAFIELSRGKLLVGAEETANGSVKGHHFAYKTDGTAVQFRKINTKIQYYNTATSLWVDVITGLTSSAQYTFANHSKLTGSFVYASGYDGLYKINVANPGSYINLTSAVTNFAHPGKILISDSRMFMWGVNTDKTGLYLSYIDDSPYTTVTNEVLGTGNGSNKTFSGTLAFKTGQPQRSGFGLTITDGTETFTDDYNGVLTGSLGGTGTINYSTGAYSVTFNTAPAAVANNVKGTYQWEDSTNKGLADFRYSAVRLAGEGDLFRQDDGGDAIQKVEVFDGVYYSLKSRSVYELNLSGDDTNATNLVFRRNIGMPYFRASVSTGQGIVFMDTADPESPKLRILQRNLTGDGVIPDELASQFDFSKYNWDTCAMDTIGEYIVFTGKTLNAAYNDRIFLYSLRWKSLDVVAFNADTFAKNAGVLYIGDSISDNVYEVFSGYDDDEFDVENEWISGADLLSTEEYKKVKRLTLEGDISAAQSVEVYVSLDNDDFTLVGTIEGTGSYVETSEAHTIGSVELGVDELGGGGSGIDVYPYMVEFKINTDKFYRRRLKFKAIGLGYASISMIKDKDIYGYGDKIPRKFRTN